MHNRLKIFNTHRAIVEEPLNLIASFIFEEISDHFCFHALTYD